MASTSKSNRPKRDWLELPFDVMANILSRLCINDVLENAQKVCTAWRRISKDPAMWRVINMNNLFDPNESDEYETEDEYDDEDEVDPIREIAREKVCKHLVEDEVDPIREIAREKVCKHLVDRSRGQLVDLTLVSTNNTEILLHVAERSCQLRRLEMVNVNANWVNTLTKFPLLEELNLYSVKLTKEEIEAVGRYCPMLKTFKLNNEESDSDADDSDSDDSDPLIAIGKTLHELRHLELIGSNLTNAALQVILDGCRHLETLDLRRCVNIHLMGDLGKRCSEQIKYLKLPDDSLEGIPHINIEKIIRLPYDYLFEELMELYENNLEKHDRIMSRRRYLFDLFGFGYCDDGVES